jgi:hypothetical protein
MIGFLGNALSMGAPIWTTRSWALVGGADWSTAPPARFSQNRLAPAWSQPSSGEETWFAGFARFAGFVEFARFAGYAGYAGYAGLPQKKGWHERKKEVKQS